MKQTHRWSLGLLGGLALLISSLGVGCAPANSVAETTGSLTLTITQNLRARTLVPDFDMRPVRFSADGQGPGGAEFHREVRASDGPVQIDGLTPGAWTITIFGFNEASQAIGTAVAEAVVQPRGTSVASVVVEPLAGDGGLVLTVDWADSAPEALNLEGTLVPLGGEPVHLEWTEAGQRTRIWSDADLPTGYYTLSLTLRDGDQTLAGATETVRILQGQTTRGSWSFTDLLHQGSLVITGRLDLHDPLEVLLTGAQGTWTEGESRLLSAQLLTDGTADLAWYLNGEPVAEGPQYQFTADQGQGTYRIDVVAIDLGGRTAGSATALIDLGPAAGNYDPSSLDIWISVVPNSQMTPGAEGFSAWASIRDNQGTVFSDARVTINGMDLEVRGQSPGGTYLSGALDGLQAGDPVEVEFTDGFTPAVTMLSEVPPGPAPEGFTLSPELPALGTPNSADEYTMTWPQVPGVTQYICGVVRRQGPELGGSSRGSFWYGGSGPQVFAGEDLLDQEGQLGSWLTFSLNTLNSVTIPGDHQFGTLFISSAETIHRSN